MPSYNTGNYISKSVESILNQSYSDWELFIVDDCSSDNTKEIIKPYLNDKRIHYYENKDNSGAAISRNFAISVANGKWIAFLDSDDLWESSKLEKQIKFMKENDIHFSYTNYYEIDVNGDCNDTIVTGPKKITNKGFYCYCWPGCLTVMYDNEYVGKIQIKNILKNNDYAMWLKISKKSDCFLLDEPLAFYRRGRIGSISTQKIISLITWHYKLFHEAEGERRIIALYHTALNVFFGLYKKFRYVSRERHIQL